MAIKLEVTFELGEIEYTCEVQRDDLDAESCTYDIDVTKVEPGYRISRKRLAEVLVQNESKFEKAAIEEYERLLEVYLTSDDGDYERD